MGLKPRALAVSASDAVEALQRELRALANPAKAAHSEKFFKAFEGGYGEGDRFHGIVVPAQRKLARAYSGLSLADTLTLLRDEFHEARLCALFILVRHFERGDEAKREEIVRAYLAHADYVNGWDLVDSSAHKILGEWLVDRDRGVLVELATADHLWKQRIAIIATLAFIYREDFATTLEIAERLLHHPHDLIHKAVGWMLREVGNRDAATERAFLNRHYREMPRTMLRYAIEKFPETERQRYLRGEI